MSAFQVSDEHINAMVHYLRNSDARTHPTELRLYRPTPEGMDRTIVGPWDEDETWIKAARILWDENQRSLCARYPDEVHTLYDTRRFACPMFVPTLKPVEILQACSCYDYQACESKDYELTLAHALVDAIRHQAIRDLPGYDDAKAWDLKDARFLPGYSGGVFRIV